MTILLVEDDMALAAGLLFTFEDEGFQTIHAKSVAEATGVKEHYDIAVIDLMLPDGNGYTVCKKIREESQVPIIFLTACDDEINVVMGLDMGADDYVTKPFRLKELMSRIKAHLRRSTPVGGMITAGNILISPEEARVTVNHNEVILTLTEMKILTLLAASKGKTVTRATMLDKIWDCKGDFVDDNTLSVHMRHLREKLADAGSSVKIATARGIGYRLEEE